MFFGISMAAVLVLLAFSLFFSPTGLDKYRKMKAEHERLLSTNRDLAAKNERLAAEVKALQDDPEYIEKTARDRIGLIRGNEIIFKLGK
jgi:cell division protein FtsB